MKTNKTRKDESVTEASAAGTETEQGLTPEALAELQAENLRLKAAIRLREAHRQITAELTKSGARSPELLFDAVKGEMQLENEAFDAVKTVERLKARFPEQFGADRPGPIDGGAGRHEKPTLTRDALRRMSPAEIAMLDWDDVKRALKK